MFYIVGLGNPGIEYENSRHNTGRMAVLRLLKDSNIEDLKIHKKSNALVSEGKIGKEKIMFILPETFMNKSGSAVSFFVKPPAFAKATAGKAKHKKGLENLVVVYDDIDLPLGTMKISYNKGSGGHKGLESIVKAVKTKEFTRIRIGVSPATPKGVVKKPGINLSPKAGEKVLLDFILGKFKPSEMEILKKVLKKASEALESLVSSGRDRAMNEFN